MAKSFQIKVPASSANIGPGFDVLGVGLQLYLTIRVTIDPTIDTSSDPHNAIITYEGNLAEKVPLQSDKNLITQAALYNEALLEKAKMLGVDFDEEEVKESKME